MLRLPSALVFAVATLACLIERRALADAPRPRDGRNQIVVSPQGPTDGGDFGPNTPGTKTSGLQEALNAAKAQVKDVYIAGGSWTVDKNQPVVYNLHETLHVPWMQDFRLDSGHCVINYTPQTGDAVVIDSQMSCSYRFGLIVSHADGAVVRMRPVIKGPDHFQVVTSSEFVFNALVGGGGAWPGGEAFDNELDKSHAWKGVGLWLDGEPGPIDGNKITVLETVGSDVGLLLTGATTRNTIEEVNVHPCRNHVQIGEASNPLPNDNRVEAFMDSQGIEPTSGARIFGSRNLLVLSTRQTPASLDLRFEASAESNIALVHSAMRVEDASPRRTNRVVAPDDRVGEAATPDVPPSGQEIENNRAFPVEVRIISPGRVRGWQEKPPSGRWTEFQAPLAAGQSFVLNPGDRVRIDYDQQPTWRWKAIR